MILVITLTSFRPLAGIRGFGSEEALTSTQVFSYVSVPLRGLEVLGVPPCLRRPMIERRFPSPCGD